MYWSLYPFHLQNWLRTQIFRTNKKGWSCSVWTTISNFSLFVGLLRGSQKNWDMPLFVPCARYSLVKGERIVRFALSTRLDIVQQLEQRINSIKWRLLGQRLWDKTRGYQLLHFFALVLLHSSSLLSERDISTILQFLQSLQELDAMIAKEFYPHTSAAKKNFHNSDIWALRRFQDLSIFLLVTDWRDFRTHQNHYHPVCGIDDFEKLPQSPEFLCVHTFAVVVQ